MAKPYSIFENAIHKLNPTVTKNTYDKSWKDDFFRISTINGKEFSELTGTSRKEVETILNDLTVNGTWKN